MLKKNEKLLLQYLFGIIINYQKKKNADSFTIKNDERR